MGNCMCKPESALHSDFRITTKITQDANQSHETPKPSFIEISENQISKILQKVANMSVKRRSEVRKIRQSSFQHQAKDKSEKSNNGGTSLPDLNKVLNKESYNKQLERDISGSNPSELFLNKQARVCQVYDFQKTLGVGQYSIVYLVENISTNEKYACKAMQLPTLNVNNNVSTGENQRQDIFREVQILCGLNHQNIVKLVEWYEEDNFIYIMMEYLAGGQLSTAIQKLSSYTEADARTCALQILKGIDYLHQNGIAHRDLKLENVMLAKEKDINTVKIVDFGFAKDSKDSFKTVAGAPWYVAPEILNEQPYDFQVDVWSFGCLLYLLLTGMPPFDDEKDVNIYKKIMKAEYSLKGELWDKISDEAQDLIKKILVVDPKQRISPKEAIQHPWFQIPNDYVDLTPLDVTQQNMRKSKHKWKRQVNVLRAKLFLNEANLITQTNLNQNKADADLSKSGSFTSSKNMGDSQIYSITKSDRNFKNTQNSCDTSVKNELLSQPSNYQNQKISITGLSQPSNSTQNQKISITGLSQPSNSLNQKTSISGIPIPSLSGPAVQEKDSLSNFDKNVSQARFSALLSDGSEKPPRTASPESNYFDPLSHHGSNKTSSNSDALTIANSDVDFPHDQKYRSKSRQKGNYPQTANVNSLYSNSSVQQEQQRTSLYENQAFEATQIPVRSRSHLMN